MDGVRNHFGSGKTTDSKGMDDRNFNIESSGEDSFLTVDPPRSINRWLIFGAWVLISLLLFAKPIYELFQLANHDETASHILLIPFITAWLLYTGRKQLQLEGAFSPGPAVYFLVPSLLMALFSLNCQACTPKTRLSGYALSLILLLVAGFIFVLGAAA